jgi:DNA-binding FrmR family transcriptional regulator
VAPDGPGDERCNGHGQNNWQEPSSKRIGEVLNGRSAALRRGNQQKLLARVGLLNGQDDLIESALEGDTDCEQRPNMIGGARDAIAQLMAEIVADHIRKHLVDEEKHSGEPAPKVKRRPPEASSVITTDSIFLFPNVLAVTSTDYTVTFHLPNKSLMI